MFTFRSAKAMRYVSVILTQLAAAPRVIACSGRQAAHKIISTANFEYPDETMVKTFEISITVLVV